jgi:hypothetical protein
MPTPHTTIIVEKIMLFCLPFLNSGECIYAVFGLMISHSRCVSLSMEHGMMRRYLQYEIGMDQIDAHQSYGDYRV